jgi:hypothetical protein
LSFIFPLLKVPYEAFETIVPADNHLQLQDLTPAEQEILKNLIKQEESKSATGMVPNCIQSKMDQIL